jgi:sulfate adenylyltransferase
VGRLKKGDYKPDVIMRSYQAAVEHYYVKERVILASISITMRYAGPNAALFLAIVRKNYGCSHYIVGRDQAGVGKYYDPYACHRIFDEFDIGVVPLRYTETFYCKSCGWMATPKTCPHPSESHIATSQTWIRSLLKEGKELPMEILRPEVARILGEGDVIIE